MAACVAALLAAPGHAPAKQEPAKTTPWYGKAWRRAVIDCHIPDWDPAFLSQFDHGSTELLRYVGLLPK